MVITVIGWRERETGWLATEGLVSLAWPEKPRLLGGWGLEVLGLTTGLENLGLPKTGMEGLWGVASRGEGTWVGGGREARVGAILGEDWEVEGRRGGAAVGKRRACCCGERGSNPESGRWEGA